MAQEAPMMEENRSYYYSQAAKNPMFGNDSTIREPELTSATNVTQEEVTTQQPVSLQNRIAQSAVQPPAPHQWKDGICDWPNNIYPSCFCVCCNCYGMYLIAQMSQKTGYQSLSSTLGAFVIVWVVSILIQIIFGGTIVIILPVVYSLCVSIALRLHMVQKYNINDCNSCQLFGECCLGFWCWYCSVAQMARHIYGYSKILDGDGDPNRPDSYNQSSSLPQSQSVTNNTYTFNGAAEIV